MKLNRSYCQDLAFNVKEYLRVIYKNYYNTLTQFKKTPALHESSESVFQRILKKNNVYLTKVNEHDFDRCVEFCDIMRDKINYDQEFLVNVSFCGGFSNVIVSRPNCPFWSDTSQGYFVNYLLSILKNKMYGQEFLGTTLSDHRFCLKTYFAKCIWICQKPRLIQNYGQ